MAKILCSISGINFSCEHVPMTLTAKEACHPIFQLPFKSLYRLTKKWADGELNEIDSYLLYLALFKSTGRVEFRVPAERTTLTTSIVASNMERLERIIYKAIYDYHPNLRLTSFVVSPETKTLNNSHIWIQTWEQNYEDWEDGYKREELKITLRQRQHKLEELINDQHRDPIRFAKILSKWAADACAFPDYQIKNPLHDDKLTPIRDYWMEIIQLCVRDEQIFLIPELHIEKLIEHCFEDSTTGINIDISGSIYGFHLNRILQSGLQKRLMFSGKGESTAFTMLDSETSVEDANKLSLIASAPEKEPKPEDYPSKFAYLKAKVAFEMKIKHDLGYQEQEAVKAKQREFDLNQKGELPLLDTENDDSLEIL